MNKPELCECIDRAISIIENVELGETDIIQKLKKYKTEALSFQAKIPFIGSYSVGKSAIINAYLGDEEILQEDINPQTALATEIRFGTEEYVELVGKDGSRGRFSLEEAKTVSVSGSLKMIYYLNRDQLKDLKDLTIVDMPGFNSGIEAHNRAIYEYLGEAAAYVFVTSVENGTLTEEEIKFLSEAKSFAPTIKYVINKCDKVIPKVTENVKNEISVLVNNIIGSTPDICVTSSRRPECGQQIASLLNTFSSSRLLIIRFGPDIRATIGSAIQCIKIKRRANLYDPRELNVRINKLEWEKEQIERKFEREKEKLHTNIQEKAVTAVLNDVEMTLRTSSTSLVSSAMFGKDKLNATINDLIRPVLVDSVHKNIELRMDEFLSNIYKDLPAELNINEISNDITFAKGGLDKAISFTAKNLDKLAKYKTLYKTVSTTLAVTTAFVAPVVEIAIIFLPEILSFINKILSSTREDEIEFKVMHEVIPAACNALRPQLLKTFNEIESEMLRKISDQFDSSISNAISAISSAKCERTKKKEDFDDYNRKLDEAEIGLKKIFSMIDGAIV